MSSSYHSQTTMANLITMTRGEKFNLEKKAKVGWKHFYMLRDDFDGLAVFFSMEREHNREIINNIKNGGDIDIEFLKKQFLELYDKVGELTDCPVCFETMTKENSEVESCGHMICKNCKDTICKSTKQECPICKKKYYIPK
jgi:hypothetical protein